jgi:hypothetical protein
VSGCITLASTISNARESWQKCGKHYLLHGKVISKKKLPNSRSSSKEVSQISLTVN